MRLRFTFINFIFLFSLPLFAQNAPDFSLVTTEGATIELYKDYLDQGKTVVIELFFVNCPPCNTFAPFMADLHESLKTQEVEVEFITLSIITGDTDEDINGFKSQYNHNWPFAGATGGSRDVIQLYIDNFGPYFGTPHTMVISPDKSIEYNVRASIGQPWIDKLETAIFDSQANHNLPPPPPPPAMAIISGGISTVDGDGLAGVSLHLSGAKDTTITSDGNGNFQTGSLIRDTAYTITLDKEDVAVNGVTTLDIVFITKHILGIDTFVNNYQYLAADVNRSGSVTTFDMVRIRQLILGIIDDFGDTKSWYFDPPVVDLASLNDLESLIFTAIKIGDVNNSADPTGLQSPIDRNTKTPFSLSTTEQEFEAGETVLITLSNKDIINLAGFQFTVEFDAKVLRFEDLQDNQLEGLSKDNFNLTQKSKGLISTSWNAIEQEATGDFFTFAFTALRSGKVSEVLEINSKLTKAEAFSNELELLAINLALEPMKNLANNSISLYPNPTSMDNIMLALDLPYLKDLFIQVWDINGKLMKTTKYENLEAKQTLDFSLSGLPSGLYTVQILSNGALAETLRLIKQ